MAPERKLSGVPPSKEQPASWQSSRSPLQRALPLLAVVALWAVIEVAFVWGGITPILRGDFPDGDGYARLLRVMRLVQTGNWYDGSLPDSNWPFGESMNWTRPLDVLLLAGSAFLQPFMNLHDALFLFGSIMSPLCALGASFASAWMAKPILGSQPRYEIMALLLLQTGVLSYTDAGRVDHHGILILSFVLACGFVLRALMQPRDSRFAFASGAMIAVGLWISTEFLPLLICALGTFGLLWLRDGERWIPLNRWFTAGFALFVAIVLPLERSPLHGLFVEEHDRISIVHLLLSLLLLAFWVLVPIAVRRLGDALSARCSMAAVATALAGGIMYSIFPKFYGGPLVAVDPALFPIWFSRIAEWQPILPDRLTGLGRLLFWLGTPLVAAPSAIRMLWRERNNRTGPAWLFIGLSLAGFIALTMRGIRFSCYADVLGLIPLYCTIAAVRRRLGEQQNWRRALLRATSVTAILLGLPFLGALVLGLSSPGDSSRPMASCRIGDLVPTLNDPKGLGSRRHVVVAHIDSGPEIMYRTGDAVLATPMHRNAAGIIAVYRLLTAADDASAKAIIDARGADLLILCPDSAERPYYASGNHENTFYNRLIDGRLPAWIRPLPPATPPGEDFRLFAVLPGAP